MNGEVVCNSHLITVLGCTKSLSVGHDEKKIRITPEETHLPLYSPENESQEKEESRRPKPIIVAAKDPTGNWQCSSYGSDEQPSAQHQQYVQSFSRSPLPVPALSVSNSLSYGLLHTNNNNNITIQCSHQKRGVHSKERRPALKSAAKKISQNRKVTDYFPIRRSSRKSKTEIKCEQKKLIDELITNGIEEGMEVQQIEGKGRAVFATRCFQKGEYVVEYHGDLLQITDAKKREAEYAQNPATGCYMYYFQYLCKTYCVDATKETGRMGRLLNHSKNGNCQTKLHDISGVPHLILVASRNIDEGEELLYDYGDRSKASIAAHPWLKD